MNTKVGRNDPCPCGSGKKYKNCCVSKSIPATRRKLTAKWINEPKKEGVNLMERTFGNAIASTFEMKPGEVKEEKVDTEEKVETESEKTES